jgi:hypothetical protein
VIAQQLTPFFFVGDWPLFTYAPSSNDQLHIGQRNPPIWRGSRTDAFPRKRRFGRSLVVVAHRGKLFDPARLQAKHVLAFPTILLSLQIEHADALQFDKAEHAAVFLLLLQTSLQQQWLDERVSKPDIGQPGLLDIDPQAQVIEFRAVASVSTRHAR